MFLLIQSLALAAEGYACEVAWSGPVAGCPIDGAISTRATRRTASSAEKAARRQLARLLELTAEDLVRVSATRSQIGYSMCDDIAYETTTVECYPDDATRDGDFCFISFEDSECWDGTVLTLDGGGWRTVVDGRRQMCESVDAALVEQNYRDVDDRRRDCADRCLVATRVDCPAWE